MVRSEMQFCYQEKIHQKNKHKFCTRNLNLIFQQSQSYLLVSHWNLNLLSNPYPNLLQIAIAAHHECNFNFQVPAKNFARNNQKKSQTIINRKTVFQHVRGVQSSSHVDISQNLRIFHILSHRPTHNTHKTVRESHEKWKSSERDSQSFAKTFPVSFFESLSISHSMVQ